MNAPSPCSLRAATSQPHKSLTTHLSLLLLIVALASTAFAQSLNILYSFGSAKHDGLFPGSGVIMDKNGNLFGATGVGGRQRNNGTVYELSPPTVEGGSWTETVLHRFNGTPDGKIAEGRLIMDSSGALFGTTLLGGAEGEGTAYMLAPPAGQATWKEKIIHSFGTGPNDASTPNLGLLSTADGLYGVDQVGANGFGAVYLLTPPSRRGKAWTQTILYSFQGSSVGDGAAPGGELVRDSAGNLYGVTAQGGVNNLGSIYEVSPPAAKGGVWTETVLFSFNGTNGTLPVGPLLLGPGGVLYGTANGGGVSGAGLVFELAPPAIPGSPWTLDSVHEFTGSADGTSPATGVISDEMGRLFGTAGGTVFMLTPPVDPGSTWTETILHSFDFSDGFIISSPLILSNNALYGTTAQGGTFGSGTVFQLTLP